LEANDIEEEEENGVEAEALQDKEENNKVEASV
jgi:hypothetical protein